MSRQRREARTGSSTVCHRLVEHQRGQVNGILLGGWVHSEPSTSTRAETLSAAATRARASPFVRRPPFNIPWSSHWSALSWTIGRGGMIEGGLELRGGPRDARSGEIRTRPRTRARVR